MVGKFATLPSLNTETHATKKKSIQEKEDEDSIDNDTHEANNQELKIDLFKKKNM